VFLADVVGTVVSPVSIELLRGRTMLLLRPVGPEGRPSRGTRIGIDVVGAGVGDRVLVVDEGNCGRQLLSAPDGAVKTVVVGVVDQVEAEGRLVYEKDRREPVGRISS
jgi:microcompartment protein CcmK/EutM